MTKQIRELIERESMLWVKQPDGSLGYCPDCFRSGAEKMYEIMRKRENKALEALSALLNDTQHFNHECGDDSRCPVQNAKNIVAELSETDGEP